MYSRPDLMHRILDVNADAVALYLNAQIDAGAQAVMIFDSWGGVLADGTFQEFSLAYTEQRAGASSSAPARTAADVPRIVFTKGGGLWLTADESARLRCAGPGLDRRTWAPPAPRCGCTATKALQGNLDPNVLFAPPEKVAAEALPVLDSFGPPHIGEGRVPRTSSTWAMASASSPRPST